MVHLERDRQSLLFKILYQLRYVSVIAVICSFAGSILMFLLGATKTAQAILLFLFDVDLGVIGSDTTTKSDLTQKLLVQSIDAFLFALVTMIFSFGVYNLFIRHTARPVLHRPFWFNVQSIGHLKNTLAELIIIILFVKFLEIVLLDLRNLSWETLILPIGIGLLAMALKLLDLRRPDNIPGAEPVPKASAEAKSDEGAGKRAD